MHYSKKIYLMLLPLAVFLCLSCPIKHEIKQVLNITTTAEVDLQKNNQIRPCTAAFSKEDLSQTSERHIDVQFSTLIADVLSERLSPQTETHPFLGQKNEAIFPIPLFIYHRKLII